MRLLFLTLCAIFSFAKLANCQDVLYTNSGDKFEVKVLEINLDHIKYKNFNYLEGPLYVIPKTDIVLIQYSNGITEVINNNPATIAPITGQLRAIENKSGNKINDPKKKELNLYYLNSNLLSINALALANGDFTVMYDKEFFKSQMSVGCLVGFNFNSKMGGLNMLIADSKANARKKYDLGLDINFMPDNTKRIQPFIGVLAKYMTYDYKELVITNSYQETFSDASAYKLALMLSYGWLYRVSTNFNFKIFGSVGKPINSVKLKEGYDGVPKVYLGYCFGYRF